MLVDRPWKRLHSWLLSLLLLISSQQTIATQHFKSTNESTMSVTTQMVNLAITAIHDDDDDEASSTTRNIWLTLEAWKTIIYHYYDLDDDGLGFSMNTLTRAVKLFGHAVDSKVSGGNYTGVHLRTHSFVKYDRDGKISKTQQVRFLLLANSKEREPNEPTNISGWIREQEKSNYVVDKTSPLFVGVRALPSFKYRATTPGSLNGTDFKIFELRKLVKKVPQIVSPTQGAVPSNVAAPTAAAAAAASSTINMEDPPIRSHDAANVSVFAPGAALPRSPPIPAPGYWDSNQARDLFQPPPEERVEACLKRRVELFTSVFNDWSRLHEILEGGEDTVSRLTQKQNNV